MGALSTGPPAIIRNAVPLHTAINGQFFMQSGLVCVSGQQCMPSDMSVDPFSTDVASIPIATAIDAAGTVIGASTIPRHARAARKRQMVSRRITAQSYHRMAKSGMPAAAAARWAKFRGMKILPRRGAPLRVAGSGGSGRDAGAWRFDNLRPERSTRRWRGRIDRLTPPTDALFVCLHPERT